VAATGFLPGVLSFLCALSHLERVAHRPSNLFFQLQSPLSPRESVVQTGQQATRSPALRGHNNQWGKIDTGFPNRLNNDRMVSWLWLWDRDSTHRLDLLRQRMHQLFQKSTQAIPKSTHRLRPRFQNGTRSLAGVGWVHAQHGRGSNGGGTLTMAHLSCFICMGSG
jgi:hypothetical protein